MIPLDLLVALTPALLVAGLWIKDLLVPRLREVRIARLWHEASSGRRIGRPV